MLIRGISKSNRVIPADIAETCGWRIFSAWALMAAGILAPFAWVWLSGLTLIHRDQAGQYAPLRSLVGQAVREGRLPLWNPYSATGMPFMADLMHGVLHPLSLAVAVVFPADGLDPLIGAYFLAAAAGAWLFARNLGASLPASVLAAFAYILSGYALSMTSNMVNLAGTGSVPWILVALRVAGRDGSAFAFAGGALAVAAGALSGDVQELAVAGLFGLILALDAGGRRGACIALGASVVGVMLAGIQIVPSWEFLHLTNRILPLPANDVNQWDLAPWRMIEFLLPGFFWVPADGQFMAPVYVALGHPTEFRVPMTESVFIGSATLFLAMTGARTSRTARLLAAAAIVVLWFAMGWHFGARSLQNILPVAKGFRYGEKFQPAFLIVIATLAALGADRLAGSTITARRAAKAACMGSALLLIIWTVLELSTMQKFFSGISQGGHILSHLRNGIPHAAVALLALAGCFWLAKRERKTPALVGMAVVVWVAAMVTVPFALRPGHPEARINVAPPPLTAPVPGPRVFNPRGATSRQPRPGWNETDQFNFDLASALAANFNVRHRVDNLSVDSGLQPIRWYLLYGALQDHVALAAPRYGVTHLIFPPPQTDKGREMAAMFTKNGVMQGLGPGNGWEIWNVPHRDWAAFPPELVVVPGPDQAVKVLLTIIEAGNPAAVIEAPFNFPAAPGRVLSLFRGLERIEIVAETAADSTLVVNDAYWPGWRAWIDSRETTIYPADLLVRAVRWPAGRHTLVMSYDPPEVRTGLWLSIAGLASLIVICVVLHQLGLKAAAVHDAG